MPGISVKLPLRQDPVDGFLLNKTYREVVKQNFKCLLLTSPGERMMDPNFGVGIKRFLFEQMDSFVYEDMQERINQQVATYMPFIEVVDVYFDTPAGQEYENYLGVRVEFFIIPLGESETLDLLYE